MRQILSGKPYPLKAMITVASNPMMWAPNTRLVEQALTHDHHIEKTRLFEDIQRPGFVYRRTAKLLEYTLKSLRRPTQVLLPFAQIAAQGEEC